MAEEPQQNTKALLCNAKGNKAFADRKYDQAINHYTQAIKLDPTNPTFYSNRAAVWGAKKHWKTSVQDALECIKLEPTGVKGYVRLGAAQMELDSLEDARMAMEKGLKMDPDNKQLLKQQHKLQHLKKEKAKASAKEALEAIQKNPKIRSHYIHLAAAEMEMGDWEASLHTVRQGLKLDPQNPQLLKQLKTVQNNRKQQQKMDPKITSSKSKQKHNLQKKQQYPEASETSTTHHMDADFVEPRRVRPIVVTEAEC